MSLASRAMALAESVPVDPAALLAAGTAVLLTCIVAVYTFATAKPSGHSKLRVFKVTGNNVVEVLEEAHRQVGRAIWGNCHR